MIARTALSRACRELAEYGNAIEYVEPVTDMAIYDLIANEENLTELAAVHYEIGQFDLALTEATRALDSSRSSRFTKIESMAHIVLGRVHHATGDPRRAFEHFRLGSEISQSLDPKIQSLAGMTTATNDQTYALRGLTLARERQMRLMESHVLVVLAEVKLTTGELIEARTVAGQALVRNRASGRRLDEGRALAVLGHFDRARQLEALAVFETIGSYRADLLRALIAG